jgi:hypothetical protein
MAAELKNGPSRCFHPAGLFVLLFIVPHVLPCFLNASARVGKIHGVLLNADELLAGPDYANRPAPQKWVENRPGLD